MAVTNPPPEVVTERPATETQSQTPPRSPKTGGIIGKILVLAVIVGLVALGLVAVLSQPKGTSTTSTTAQNPSTTAQPTVSATQNSELKTSTTPVGVQNLSVSALVADPADFKVLFAATPNGLLKTSDGGKTWAAIEQADVFKGVQIQALASDPDSPQRPFYAATDNGLFKTIDGGKTWKRTGLDNRNIVAIAARKDKVYAAVSGLQAGVYYSTDQGQNWKVSSAKQLPANIDIRAIAVDSTNPSKVYIGTAYQSGGRADDWDRIKFSEDGGATWKRLGYWNYNTEQPDAQGVISLIYVATGDRIYASDGKTLYRLSPDRQSWQPNMTGLPEDGVQAITGDPQVPGILYASTKSGFFINTDGQKWNKLADSEAVGSVAKGLAVPAIAAVNTFNNAAISVNGLSTTMLYTLGTDGQLGKLENRDFGNGVLAQVQNLGVNLADFTLYGGVNPAAGVVDSGSDNSRKYFPDTKHYLSQGFKLFWEANDGAKRFGAPITEEFSEFNEVEKVRRQVQYFERGKLEFQPERPVGQEIQAALLGNEAIAGQYFAPGRQVADSATERYFSETKHTIRLGFKQFWEDNGGRAILGLPITEEFDEKTADGKTLVVQYFERAKLTFNKETGKVEVANLGIEVLKKRRWRN